MKLSKHWTEELLKHPETGMGYQRVDIVLKSGQTIKDVLALNAEDLVLPTQHSSLRPEEIADLIVRT